MKCFVKDCKNHAHEGMFLGGLCGPCHEFIAKGEGTHSQAYRNSRREWVGLTDDDLIALPGFDYNEPQFIAEKAFARAIEAKLKEKNT